MITLDSLPKRSCSHDIEADAEQAFTQVIHATRLFYIQKVDHHDYGTDIQIEARQDASMTNYRVHVQLKGTTSAQLSDGSVSVSVKRSNLNYLLAQPFSIYVCYHLPSNQLFVKYAEDIYRDIEVHNKNSKNNKTLTIKFCRILDNDFLEKLHDQVIVTGKLNQDARLSWSTTPPELIPVKSLLSPPHIDIPNNSNLALDMLTSLYVANNDLLISGNFTKFEAVLGSVPEAMNQAYMAEINLAMNGYPFDKQRVKRGIEEIEKVKIQSVDQPGSLSYCMANGYLALQDYDEAERHYNIALAVFESVLRSEYQDQQINIVKQLSALAAQCYKNLGSLYEKTQNQILAQKAYEQALELNPDLAEAHFSLANLFRISGNYQEAVTHFDAVIWDGNEITQRFLSLLGWRANVLFNLQDITGAFRDIYCLISHAVHADWIWPWCAKQITEFGMNNPESALKSIRFWDRYLVVHHNDPRARYQYLFCHWFIKLDVGVTTIDFEEFKNEALRLVDEGYAKPAFMWDRIGHWAESDEKWHEAENAYRTAVEIEPDKYGYCLGSVLNRLERYEDALPILLDHAKNHNPDAVSWFQIAITYEGLGRIQDCIEAYKKTIELDQEHDEAWFNLGRVYFTAGDYTLARETWQKAVEKFPDSDLIHYLTVFGPDLARHKIDFAVD